MKTKKYEAQVAEIRWQEQEWRLAVTDGAFTLVVNDKFKRRDALVTAMRALRKGAGK